MKLLMGTIRPNVFEAFDLKNATINIKDGASNSIAVKLGNGNLTFTEHRAMEYRLDRGKLDDVRAGDEQPVDVKLEFTWEYLKGPASESTTTTGLPTISDALKQRGPAAAWVSSDSGHTCRPYAVDLEIVFDPICAGNIETITLPDFRYEQLDHDAKAGTISVTGKCNTTQISSVRTVNS